MKIRQHMQHQLVISLSYLGLTNVLYIYRQFRSTNPHGSYESFVIWVTWVNWEVLKTLVKLVKWGGDTHKKKVRDNAVINAVQALKYKEFLARQLPYMAVPFAKQMKRPFIKGVKLKNRSRRMKK